MELERINKMIEKERYILMVDLETLGINDDALITQIGAVIYDLKEGKILTQFNGFNDLRELDRRFNNIIYDLSTLDISDRDSVSSKLNYLFNIYSEVLTKYKVERSTLEFWCSTEKNYKKLMDILNNDNRLPDYLLAIDFIKFIKEFDKGNLTIWGNGIAFDVVKINRMFKRLELENPISFTQQRDVRTWLALTSMLTGYKQKSLKKLAPKNEYQHDALQDAIYQANYCYECFNLLRTDKNNE